MKRIGAEIAAGARIVRLVCAARGPIPIVCPGILLYLPKIGRQLGQERKLTMYVREHMSPSPVTIRGDVDLHSALRLLQERAFRRLPVTDGIGRILGVVTERDLLLAVSHYLNSPIDVESIMTRPVVTITPDTLIAEAAMLMVSNKIGGLPVVDSDQRVVGIITESDIFRAFVDILAAGAVTTSSPIGI
jgi:CBS domain-containing protein